jgi:excisionase family DNA binding protein
MEVTMKTTELPCRPCESQPGPASAPAGGRIDEIYGLLRSLSVAVEEMRALLAAKRKDHYTVEEVAAMTGRSPYTIRRWILEERIKAIRIEGTGPKGRLLVPRGELNNLVSAGMGASIPAAVLS